MKKMILKILLPFALIAGGSSMLLASDGDLDTSFGGDGKVTYNYDNSHYATGVSIQNDNKIIVVGSVYNYNDSTNEDFVLLRYHLDGSLDTTFDGDGKVYTDFNSGSYDVPMSVVIQSDGKIVVAGQTSATQYGTKDFALARYNSNGSLDTTFGNSGKVITNFGANDFLQDVVIQNDGKIIVVGGSSNNFALVRYNSDGSLDTTFDTDGKVTADLGGQDEVRGVAIQSDGKIIAAGTTDHGIYSYDFALVRYNSNGSLDTTFDTDGKVTTDFGTNGDQINGVAIQSDGKIVAVGEIRDTSAGEDYDFALARYNPEDGSLDATFGSAGKMTTDLGGNYDKANSVAIQKSGKIVVAGGGASDFALVRYTPEDGSLDTTFGADGIVTTDFNGEYDSASSIAIYDNGNIIAVGSAGKPNYFQEYGLARYESEPCLTGYRLKQGEDICIPGTSTGDPGHYVPSCIDGRLTQGTTDECLAADTVNIGLYLPSCLEGETRTQGTDECIAG